MIIGRKRSSTKAEKDRLQATLDYAISVIKKSKLSGYVSALYLYGSCARNTQKITSDVDLLLELNDKIDIAEYTEEIRKLKSEIIPLTDDLMDIDLAVVIGDTWKTNKMLYYSQIKKEGKNIWIP